MHVSPARSSVLCSDAVQSELTRGPQRGCSLAEDGHDSQAKLNYGRVEAGGPISLDCRDGGGSAAGDAAANPRSPACMAAWLYHSGQSPQPDDCDYCEESGKRKDDYPCSHGQQYYARGPLQVRVVRAGLQRDVEPWVGTDGRNGWRACAGGVELQLRRHLGAVLRRQAQAARCTHRRPHYPLPLPCPTWQPPPDRLAATAGRSVRAWVGL